MPLLFPIAKNARAALDAEGGARTIAEARELAGGPVTLASEWLRPTQAEHEEIEGKAQAGVSRGFVQFYEDAKGQPVFAVSFWKLVSETKTKPAKKGKAAKVAAESEAPPAPVEDHTDDLYFAKKGAKAKRKKKAADPSQLDLFAGPDQQGAESPDPHNPLVVIVEEEGSGAAFGLGDNPLGDIPEEPDDR
jgi:hypothetical protein